MILSLERLKYLAARPSEVYAKETQAMARMCINAHPDSSTKENTTKKEGNNENQ